MLATMSAAPKLTLADLDRLGPDARVALIGGAIEPKAAPSWAHSDVQSSLMTWLRRYRGAPGGRWPGGWWIGVEVHVVYGAHDVFCHDLVGWRRDRVPVMPRGWVDIRPDWACEVLSPGHERRDLVEKMGVLHAAGVPHYWVADREERALFPYVFDPRGYLMTRAIAAGEVLRLPPFEATELRTGILFGDEDDAE